MKNESEEFGVEWEERKEKVPNDDTYCIVSIVHVESHHHWTAAADEYPWPILF